jgi:hypothetical protein
VHDPLGGVGGRLLAVSERGVRDEHVLAGRSRSGGRIELADLLVGEEITHEVRFAHLRGGNAARLLGTREQTAVLAPACFSILAASNGDRFLPGGGARASVAFGGPAPPANTPLGFVHRRRRPPVSFCIAHRSRRCPCTGTRCAAAFLDGRCVEVAGEAGLVSCFLS